MSSTQAPLRLTRRGWVVALSLPVVLIAAFAMRLGDGEADGSDLGDVLTVTDDATDAAPRIRVDATWGVPEPGFLLDGEVPAGNTLVETAPVVVVAASAAEHVAIWLAGTLQAPLVVTDPDADGPPAAVIPDAWGTRVAVDVGDTGAQLPDGVRRISLATPGPATDAPTDRSDAASTTPTVTAAPSTGETATDVPTTETTAASTDTPSEEPTTAPSAPDRAPSTTDIETLADVRLALSEQPEVDLDPVRELLENAPEPSDDRPFTALVRPDEGPASLVPLVLAGARIEQTDATDLFAADAELVAGLTGPVVQAGTPTSWDDVDQATWEWQQEVVAAGVELPGGGYRVFPEGRRYISLYGSPETTALGVLGEQGVDASVERARGLAADYDGLDAYQNVPAWDLIATVASGSPEPTDDYSRRVPQEIIREWVDVARDAGVYVLLDLQSGRTDFLTQARELEELLLEPNVGLALDPEWRLKPDQRHLVQIGSVSVEEVNEVGDWLAELTRTNGLPQKMYMVHQFTSSMFRDKASWDDWPELGEIVQMDGQGSQPGKLSTWESVTKVDSPPHVVLGWKNFYDEDPETRSPADTVTIDPIPVFVSYQ